MTTQSLPHEKPHPLGKDYLNLPKKIQDYIFNLEDNNETALQQKNYYKIMCIMLLSSIRSGEFNTEDGNNFVESLALHLAKI